MIEIAYPYELSEQLAFLTACATVLIGAILMIFPVRMARFLGLIPLEGTQNGISEIRGPFAGMWVGLGLACIILAQPFTYFALGTAFLFAVLGRLISFVFDRSFNFHCLIATAIEVAGAVFTLYFALQAFGIV